MKSQKWKNSCLKENKVVEKIFNSNKIELESLAKKHGVTIEEIKRL